MYLLGKLRYRSIRSTTSRTWDFIEITQRSRSIPRAKFILFILQQVMKRLTSPKVDAVIQQWKRLDFSLALH